MVERYGDFVLYRPPFKAQTLLLWLGPFVLLALGALVVWRIVGRRRRVATDAPPVSDARRAEIQSLLEK
jgi:cytochrome c-type biogenesis protein CcmH